MNLKIAPYITLEQGDTGDVYANVFTPIGQFIATLPFDNMFMLNQKEMFGSKIYGLGNQYLTTSAGIQSVNKLYFYFYNTTDYATLNNEGKLPSFMNYLLDIDESKLVAYACDVTVIDSNKLKQGITKEREGIINTTQPITGCTMYFPAGYGTGEINAMAVSLVDLSTLKTMASANAKNSVVFGGVQFEVSVNYTSYSRDYGLIKPNTPGLTTAEEILLKLRNVRYKYNMVTGDYSLYTETFPSNSEFPYLCNSVLIGDKLYFNRFTSSGFSKIIELNLTTKTERSGTQSSVSDATVASLIKIGSELYIQTSSSATEITLKKIDLTTLAMSTGITVVPPAYLGAASRSAVHITQFDDDTFGLLDGVIGICYKFTDIANVENSIVDVYFTGINVLSTVPIKNGVNTLFVGVTENGFYKDTTLSGKNNGKFKVIMSDGRYGPIIAHNKFDTFYNKSETAELTSSFMITASAL